MSRAALMAAASLCMLASISAANAADFRITSQAVGHKIYGDRCLQVTVSMTGTITPGDTAKLKGAIGKVDADASARKSVCNVNDGFADRLITLEMESDGGAYGEGWSLAKAMTADKDGIGAYVPAGKRCLSACAVAFMGGHVNGADGARLIARSIHPTAVLGFHAPYPVLDKPSYTSAEVMRLFQDAFILDHDFADEIGKLGISAEVSNLLMQPTPDDVYRIDNVGRALLTRTSVRAEFSFSVFETGVPSPKAIDIVNLCYNNQTIATHGNIEKLLAFISDRQKQKLNPLLYTRSYSKYFSSKPEPVDAYVVPVQDAGEGEVMSCVVAVRRATKTDPERFACIGLEYGDQQALDKITKNGVDSIVAAQDTFCRTSDSLALLPPTTKLRDVPAEYLK